MSVLSLKRASLLFRLSREFARGLASMVSAGQTAHPFPYKSRNAAEALRGDWERVGQGLGRTIERARIREKA